jgi:hypothetical protein
MNQYDLSLEEEEEQNDFDLTPKQKVKEKSQFSMTDDISPRYHPECKIL